MKKTLRLVIVFMMIAVLAISMTSCSKMLFGKYSTTTTSEFAGVVISSTTTVYEFSGKNVTYIRTTDSDLADGGTTTKSGTYEIADDVENPGSLVIAFDFEGEERVVYSFSEGENASGEAIITINGVDYKKVQD